MRINGACRGLQRDGHWNRTSDGLFVVSSVCRFSAPSVRTWSLRRIHASVRSRRLAATICLVRWIPRADLFGVLLPCGRYERFAASSESTSRRRDIGGLCVCAWPDLVLPFCSGASVIQTLLAGWSARLKRNTVLSTHIRCSTTPSLRATATTARFIPRR